MATLNIKVTVTDSDASEPMTSSAVFSLTVLEVFPLRVDPVTGDNVINITEKAAGFTISRRHRGGGRRHAVTVTLGDHSFDPVVSALADHDDNPEHAGSRAPGRWPYRRARPTSSTPPRL